MRRYRQGCLAAIALASALSATQARGNEPEFRLLQLAEELSAGQVMQVQFGDDDFFGGSSEQVGQQGTQPLDIGPTGGLEMSGFGDLPEDFGFGDWSLISNRSLDGDTTAAQDSPTYVDELGEKQGISEVSLTEAPAVDIVSASTFNLTTTTDVAETLANTSSTQTVRARRRSSVGFDPRIRGFYTGQIYAMHDGAYQFPARSDLDGVFSKIDQALIGNVQIISGPYSVRYGSGFAFFNVDTVPTPRYDCGWENHLRMGTHVRTNGGQTYNTATLYGGGESVGYFANVGYRKGSDYQSGDGLYVPSSYDTLNLFSGIGFDLNDNTRSELHYTHIDQGNTEYAGQFFDVDDLKGDAITHSLIHHDERSGFGYRVDSWVNNSEFNGDTTNGSKRRTDFPVLQRVDRALLQVADPANGVQNPQFFGNVDGELLSAGYRAGMTQKIDRDRTIGLGTDFRYVRQEIAELIDLNQFLSRGVSPSPLGTFDGGVPAAEIIEPGLYAEYSFALRDYIHSAVGARVSFATTQADERDVDADSNFRDPFTNEINADLDVSDILYSWFFTNDIDLAPAWSARVGLGYAERLPNLEQRYSDGLYLAVIQNGFSRVIGNPTLSKERNWQVDAQLKFNSELIRSRLSGFHSWIVDYITYQANVIDDPLDARLLRTINTDYATLTGFEYYCEADLSDGWQAFGSLAYLDGRDREINQPLAGINPLEGRAGFRWFDVGPRNAWGLEWGLRMVDNQDRLGTLRAAPPATNLVLLESATPGFTTSYLRAFCRPTDNVNITAGVENLFDNNYYEHLNLRLPRVPVDPNATEVYGQTVVYSPGITPYLGVEVTY